MANTGSVSSAVRRGGPAIWPTLVVCAVAACPWLGCSNELGDCDAQAAREVVYGTNRAVATKGQALVHDSCGNGVFCHSAAATGTARHGAPKGMDFDMLPTPTGLRGILERREAVWDVVHSGQMPPSNLEALVGDGKWSFDLQRRPEAPLLPRLSSDEGKAALRNWLACGAPAVTDTRAPAWAQPAENPFVEGEPVAWKDLYEVVMVPSCAQSGCHDGTTAAGSLPMRNLCQTRDALLGSGACGQAAVVPGDPGGSFLVEKLESEQPRCGSAMPPSGPLPAAVLAAIRSWIEAGAPAPDCL